MTDGDAVTLDDLDRQIVAALQIHGRATWQQIARAVGTSDTTVARRAQRMFNSGIVRVVASTDPLRCGYGYPVMMQVKCRVGQSPRVAAELARRPDVRFIALVTGSFDIVLELIVSSQRELARILFHGIEAVDGITSTVTENVIAHYKVAHVWSHGTLDDDATRLLAEARGAIEETEPTPLDERDQALVELLADDARLSFAALAGELGISESMAKRRVTALVRDGRMRFSTIVNPELLGYGVEVICWLGMDLRYLDDAARQLAARPEVRYVAGTAGYSDLSCEVVLRDQADLHRFSTAVLAHLPGLRTTEIGLELATLKRAYTLVDTPFGTGPDGEAPA
ncbi:Lrp/AsnC family transcriptional regulator [Phytoactinopolyspora halotolerans]|uniref:Lrp/AsnC family transcriptional regulator n=1 Tax=Phytoactinopolyspora halotolerans TaxID=1981512 RepID=A0A6L9S6P8_9ACTN|nr:Lrp/AsnC family transcriptional regulator [Phytoactinopolyspora halotolerans]NEE00334.1 Lrp/AsnC family transcriptional regulator [Phytoactinopolyspora halotolerans]